MTNWLPQCECVRVQTEAKLEELRDKYGAKLEPKENKDACTWLLKGPMNIAVVYVKDSIDPDSVDFIGLIAHEATHCAFLYTEEILEDKVGEETFCYLVQAFFTAIMYQV